VHLRLGRGRAPPHAHDEAHGQQRDDRHGRRQPRCTPEDIKENSHPRSLLVRLFGNARRTQTRRAGPLSVYAVTPRATPVVRAVLMPAARARSTRFLARGAAGQQFSEQVNLFSRTSIKKSAPRAFNPQASSLPASQQGRVRL
jgi:hypothetical protein